MYGVQNANGQKTMMGVSTTAGTPFTKAQRGQIFQNLGQSTQGLRGQDLYQAAYRNPAIQGLMWKNPGQYGFSDANQAKDWFSQQYYANPLSPNSAAGR